jgi:hypothetical protein
MRIAYSSTMDCAMYGPFHRQESPTQTKADADQQQLSGEIWGGPARGSLLPSVKAYRSALPASVRGIEFDTAVRPTPGSGTKHEARWYTSSPGVSTKNEPTGTYAAITWTRFVHGQP